MPAPSLAQYRMFEIRLADREALTVFIRGFVETYSPRGIPFIDMLREVVDWAINDDDDLLRERIEFQQHVISVLSELEDDKVVGFNRRDQVWFYRGSRDLTPEAAAFLRSRGFGDGWKTISDPKLVIDWMLKTLTPQQFERFCISLLSEHCKLSVCGTAKKRRTGADGGMDGFGEIELDGQIYPLAIEVKAYATYRKVGYEPCERLAGKMARHGWKHGLIITSGTFNDEAQECVADLEAQQIFLETVDQDRLLAIMLEPNGRHHGYGLFKSTFVSKFGGKEKTLFYVNEKDIVQAAV